jgi:hypothetical protein
MSTQTYRFSGMTKWAKVRTPDELYNNYQVPLYLNDEDWNVFENSGLRLKVKTDDDGKYVTFRRKHIDKNRKGEDEEIGPPKIAIRDGDDYKDFPEGLIGNGSKITVWVDVYDTRQGKGHRLIGVGIDELVEYNPEGNTGIRMPF